MSDMSQESVLREIVACLRRALAPEAIYLFGSRARDSARAESDYDLLIVVRSSALPGHHRDRLALRALRHVHQAVDVLVLTSEEFARKRGVVTSLPATVLREGRLLYAA